MERLWAPWRLEYVEQEKPQGCIFCSYPKETGDEADRRNLVLGRSAHSFAMLNRYPYTSGHLMVVPRRHTARFDELPAAELQDLTELLQRTTAYLRAAYRCEGVNLGMNLGRAAGAGIDDHLHWHAVPRWTGDTNFMSTLGDVRVVIEHLQRTWEKLRPYYAA